VAACIAEVIRAAGRIDAVINNAGIGIAGAIEDTTATEAQAQFQTNFFGTQPSRRFLSPAVRRCDILARTRSSESSTLCGPSCPTPSRNL
jgi:NAD(P)-dependent dehydrogenase (short-subunit alcohol dehydrogenase family)